MLSKIGMAAAMVVAISSATEVSQYRTYVYGQPQAQRQVQRMPYRPMRPQHSPYRRPVSRPVVSQPAKVEKETINATCKLEDPQGQSGVSGVVSLTQTEGEKISISAIITGLPANSSHGFHVHQFGDISEGCGSTGGHFNPEGTDHGAFDDPSGHRHAGDLKSVVTNARGEANYSDNDNEASLFGAKSIVGRGMVLHAGADDLGRGGNASSLANGNAGARIACCVIGIAKDEPVAVVAQNSQAEPVPQVPQPMNIVGGFSELKKIDARMNKILTNLRADIEKEAGTTYRYFQPIGFEQQVVAGKKYKVQVNTEQGRILVTIIEPLPFTNKPPFVTTVESI